MTGGRVVVLGSTGRNFAAGMSGGVAYVFDEAGNFATRCNQQSVSLEHLDDTEEAEEVRQMIQRHAHYTGSHRAANILGSWEQMAAKFVKVMPKDYKRMLAKIKQVSATGLSGEQALMAAFEANAKDLARIGGS
jgi:glutamate synthase (ferredoxin)